MSQGTATEYNVINNKMDQLDILTLCSPAETPFFTSAPKYRKVRSDIFEYYADNIDAVSLDTIGDGEDVVAFEIRQKTVPSYSSAFKFNTKAGKYRADNRKTQTPQAYPTKSGEARCSQLSRLNATLKPPSAPTKKLFGPAKKWGTNAADSAHS